MQRQPEWAAPLLWRSELRNILVLYMRKRLLDFERAFQSSEEHSQSSLWDCLGADV